MAFIQRADQVEQAGRKKKENEKCLLTSIRVYNENKWNI
jgi:hypothetical protein